MKDKIFMTLLGIIVIIKSRRQFVEVTITVDTSTGGSTSGTCTKI